LDQKSPVQIKTPAKIMWYTFNRETASFTAGAQMLGLSETQRKTLQQFLSLLPPQ
jgi:hypothetical protein